MTPRSRHGASGSRSSGHGLTSNRQPHSALPVSTSTAEAVVPSQNEWATLDDEPIRRQMFHPDPKYNRTGVRWTKWTGSTGVTANCYDVRRPMVRNPWDTLPDGDVEGDIVCVGFRMEPTSFGKDDDPAFTAQTDEELVRLFNHQLFPDYLKQGTMPWKLEGRCKVLAPIDGKPQRRTVTLNGESTLCTLDAIA